MTSTVEKYINGERYIEGYCHSSETKPEGVFALGSHLYEVDTGKTYYYAFDAFTEAVNGSGE